MSITPIADTMRRVVGNSSTERDTAMPDHAQAAEEVQTDIPAGPTVRHIHEYKAGRARDVMRDNAIAATFMIAAATASAFIVRKVLMS